PLRLSASPASRRFSPYIRSGRSLLRPAVLDTRAPQAAPERLTEPPNERPAVFPTDLSVLPRTPARLFREKYAPAYGYCRIFFVVLHQLEK
ncbi:hypothetical protein, partial [uncultured Alistipes sp.]